MNIEIINTGSELMLGRVLNTHQRWICRQLADAGWIVTRQLGIPDNGPAIRDAVAEALARAELVITTGGLGPTSDDITRDLVAELLGLPLREDSSIREAIARFFAIRGREAPESVMVQARVPEGARVLANACGTAPGLVIQVPAGRLAPHGSWLVMLPGPPRELHPMFTDQVVPLLRQCLPEQPRFTCVTLRTTGIGESWLEERLAPHLPPLLARGLEVGYCARSGEVDVRLAGRGESGVAVVQQAEALVRARLGESIYGTGDDSLEQAVIRCALQQAARLAVAESCTGGLVSHRLTNVPGASQVYWGGWVTYDNQAKTTQLGVAPALLAAEGAVSEACARSMAEGARTRAQATHAVAITGIAGPTGATPGKPVGTAFIAVASPHGTLAKRFLNSYDRETFKQVTSQQALEMLRRSLLHGAGTPPAT